MNLKVRLKNPVFWWSVILAVVTPIFGYYGITAKDITTWSGLWYTICEAASNPYVIVTVIVSLYNALIDPTTTGITDSARAKQYSYPNSVKE